MFLLDYLCYTFQTYRALLYRLLPDLVWYLQALRTADKRFIWNSWSRSELNGVWRHYDKAILTQKLSVILTIYDAVIRLNKANLQRRQSSKDPSLLQQFE